MMNFVSIVILCILDQIRFELVGNVSAFDIFVIFYFWLYVMKNRGLGVFQHDAEIMRLSKCFAALLVVQIVSEALVDNSLQNAAKGVAVTAMCYLKFLFVLGLFFKNRSNIVFFLVGTLIANILFFRVNDFFGLGEMDVDFQDVKSGEGIAMAYFKFKISPLINSAAVLLSVWLRFKNLKASIVFIALGAISIVLGARGNGLILLVSGLIPLFLYERIRWNKKKVFVGAALVLAVGAYSYKMYVDSVLSGKIYGGNAHTQIAKMDNPYNVLELLKIGRTEPFVGLNAFADSPWVGWGAWARDPGMYYNTMLLEIQGARIDKRKLNIDVIPTHSVIVGYGVYNGVLAMLLSVLIIAFFIRCGVIALRRQSIFSFVLTSSLIGLIWDSLFSPISSMRFQFVLYFACIYYIYKMMQYPDLAYRYGYIEKDNQ